MKKNKATELDVDFIGGQGPLTENEKKAISEFLKAQKMLRAKKHQESYQRKGKAKQRSKVAA